MPRFDGTGPRGQGPITGRGEGFCAVPVSEDAPANEHNKAFDESSVISKAGFIYRQARRFGMGLGLGMGLGRRRRKGNRRRFWM